ncbi:arginine N-succinyltransferase [Erythrobacter sp.]|uniref:arginine N-succinyltransferase n=1 Tax=Erythrobacter sp. TaxID=1042 RepID=UPI002EB985CC|nr:arginine N-succinyltransferase [Erythrobacter sp.]
MSIDDHSMLLACECKSWQHSAVAGENSGGGVTSGKPFVRVARTGDIDDLLRLAMVGGDGLTNLPPNRAKLQAKLEASEEAIASPEAREAGAAILLMVEYKGRIVGTSCVFPKVGAEWPFYSYRLTRQAALSTAVGRRHSQVLLNLVNDFDGECEVGGLFVDPDCRGMALGQLAARARYLFIASHRDWFGEKVIAELRGYQDANGQSPVWNAIGRHFYDMDFSEADRTGALKGNQFIADLGPRYPLYVSLLPRAAQDALDKPHDDGRPALQMLLAEGFRSGEYVDIFDGGPTLTADIDVVRTIRKANRLTFEGAADRGETRILAASKEGANFRAAFGECNDAGNLDRPTAEVLGLELGEDYIAVNC